MFRRVFRGAIVGLFAAFAAYSLNADYVTSAVLLGVAIVVAVVDILAGEIFALMVVFAIGALVWTYTPVGKYVASEIQKRSQEPATPKQETTTPKKSE